MSDRIFNPSKAHKLEDPERRVWLPPGEILSLLDLRPGMNIVDIGAGTGFFAIPLAEAIAPGGRLFAVDVQPEMLAILREKLSGPDAPANIALFEGEAARTNLPGSAFDLIFMAHIWHEIDDHAAVLREASRLLVKGGRIAVVDWRTDVDRPPGPPLEHRISADQTSRSLESNGWNILLSSRAGRYSYLVTASL